MKAATFDEIVRKRANERVQIKLNAFREAIMSSCKVLIGDRCGYQGSQAKHKSWHPDYCRLLKILASDDNQGGWPATIWAEEFESVSKELLAIMDEMQKALLAPGAKEDDMKPGTEPK
jgi:hypothetical protein